MQKINALFTTVHTPLRFTLVILAVFIISTLIEDAEASIAV